MPFATNGRNSQHKEKNANHSKTRRRIQMVTARTNQ